LSGTSAPSGVPSGWFSAPKSADRSIFRNSLYLQQHCGLSVRARRVKAAEKKKAE